LFYYYGRKKQIVRCYPEPECPTIIEPFAGSAAYALHHKYRFAENQRIILVEKNSRIAQLWHWLLHEAVPEDVRDMPDLIPGQKTKEFLHVLHAVSNQALSFKNEWTVHPMMANVWNRNKGYMADQIGQVQRAGNWEVIEGDYTDAPDIEATWFIDPPYEGPAGMGYGKHSSDKIDYEALGEWCRTRKGQVIVCEGPGLHGSPSNPS